MKINESVLSASEKILLALKSLYFEQGYSSYKMSKFEEYDLYAKNKEFLVSDNVITFTDVSGKLMALKPDVTLSIIKNSKDLPETVQKVFYSENVYRAQNGDSFKEIMQTGVEAFGKIDEQEVVSVITLAAQSLKMLAEESVLDISCLSVLSAAINQINVENKEEFFALVGEKNMPMIQKKCADDKNGKLIEELCLLSGKLEEVLPKLKELVKEIENKEILSAIAILEALSKSEYKDMLRLDFSVIDDTNYYNGIVFKGFISGIPQAVLSGGQYDKLMKKLSRTSKAIGFAVYVDALERIEEASADDGFLNVALPKGRLGERVYKMFEQAGYECPSLLEPNRKLIFENEQKKVRYFWVKPSDVAQYVERGAADVGVAGKDILLEYQPDVYELCDLNTGKCRMAVAAPKDFVDDTTKTLVVATKFSNIAKKFYQGKGRDIDIIHLNGSIEIAPILRLSDVIVDIVETGATLKENDLEVFETITDISARLICNKASYKFKTKTIEEINACISKLSKEKE